MPSQPTGDGRKIDLRCPCGRALVINDGILVWYCPETDDGTGYGRPKKGHYHYIPDEALDDPYALRCIMRGE